MTESPVLIKCDSCPGSFPVGSDGLWTKKHTKTIPTSGYGPEHDWCSGKPKYMLASEGREVPGSRKGNFAARKLTQEDMPRKKTPEPPYDANGFIISSHRVHVWQDKPWKPHPGWNASCTEEGCRFGSYSDSWAEVIEEVGQHVNRSGISRRPL